jgi:hypothetical protein
LYRRSTARAWQRRASRSKGSPMSRTCNRNRPGWLLMSSEPSDEVKLRLSPLRKV